jgi:hypothetical protein
MGDLVTRVGDRLGGARAGARERLDRSRQMGRMGVHVGRRLRRRRAFLQQRSNVRRHTLAQARYQLRLEVTRKHLKDDLHVFHREPEPSAFTALGLAV